MRRLLFLFFCLAAAQDGPASRPSISNDWCRVEFAADRRTRALEVLTALTPARARVLERLGVGVAGPLTLLVASDADDMGRQVRARTGREPPDWAGGLALPELSLVMVRGDLAGEPFDRVDSVVTHELVHIALAQARQPDDAPIPRWFEEGLAQWVAGRARPLDVPDLRPAATFGYLLDLSEMNAAFAHGEGAAARAYAQAESFVRFVARRHGATTVRDVTKLVLEGVALDAALFMKTSATLNTLWGVWEAELAADRSWMLSVASQALVALLILVVVVLGVGRVLKRKRAIEETWGEERE